MEKQFILLLVMELEIRDKMENINDYAEQIKNFSMKNSFLSFQEFDVSQRGLHCYLEKDNERLDYHLSIDGNEILGYNLLMTGIVFNLVDRTPREKNKITLEEVVELNKNIANEFKFNNLIVHVGNKFTKEICEKRKYQFEKDNPYPVAVKRLI